MNKTMKIALCIGLTGLGMFVWTHFAAAKGKPASTPVVVTFLSGDVIATQPLVGRFTSNAIVGGPFTAIIDFLKYIPYICPDSPAGGEAVLKYLQDKNPITYDSLSVKVNADPLFSRLDFKATIDGVSYTVTMNAFLGGLPTESTPTLDTIHLREGRFAINKGAKLAVVAGDPVRQVNLDFSMTK
jgi:hypothetical protein